MNKLKMHSPDLTQANIDKLAELFPHCLTETRGADGSVRRGIDFDQLRQELSTSIVEGPQERYQLNWPGKREALLTANAPIAKTLRPCREESVDFDTTQNLFIEGDNLDALKLLQETYLNKVKLIYIDPPYNTGKDFIYEDDFAEDSEAYKKRSNQKDDSGNRLVANTETNGRFHSDWLSMVYSRLRLAQNMLRDDGLIVISIDSGEAANLRVLMDEVFGAKNFVGLLPTVMNLKGNNDAFAFSDTHEFTIVYAKSRAQCVVHELPIDESKLDEWDEDERGLFKRADTLRRTGQDASREKRPNGWFPVFITPANEIYATEDDLPRAQDDVVLWPQNDDGDELSWTWSKRKINAENFNLCIVQGRNGLNIYKKQRASLGDLPTSKPKSILYKPEYSSSNGTAEVGELLGKNVFDSPPKPRALLRDFLLLGAEKDSIIVDFFGGSGTTGHAVMAQNAADNGIRRFILVQLAADCEEGSNAAKAGFKTVAEITKQRLRKAGEKIRTQFAGSGAPLDLGFRVLKIDSSNMKEVFYTPDAVSQDLLSDQVNNIREDRTSEDLLFQVLLDWGVDLALPITQETIAGKAVYFVDGNALAACFEEGVSEEFVKLLAKQEPLRVVFRDAGFASDSVKINVEQIFKLMSPSTEVKCI
ncbi:site-specific DNA-methyltransferase [Paracidovorax valerianellae]|uniref:site-specific DNA-methyltransferase n=1 Tax=Paracidovorax valerianellae TaxID=187868 RepID=UPI0023036D0D|nr:site-specific DNA-methyltransferase [Paracidovorax valerianellae]MDA8446790.1 site-specific DNA-methyltransferase [Paracidovorax valerianellae]